MCDHYSLCQSVPDLLDSHGKFRHRLAGILDHHKQDITQVHKVKITCLCKLPNISSDEVISHVCIKAIHLPYASHFCPSLRDGGTYDLCFITWKELQIPQYLVKYLKSYQCTNQIVVKGVQERRIEVFEPDGRLLGYSFTRAKADAEDPDESLIHFRAGLVIRCDGFQYGAEAKVSPFCSFLDSILTESPDESDDGTPHKSISSRASRSSHDSLGAQQGEADHSEDQEVNDEKLQSKNHVEPRHASDRPQMQHREVERSTKRTNLDYDFLSNRNNLRDSVTNTESRMFRDAPLFFKTRKEQSNSVFSDVSVSAPSLSSAQFSAYWLPIISRKNAWLEGKTVSSGLAGSQHGASPDLVSDQQTDLRRIQFAPDWLTAHETPSFGPPSQHLPKCDGLSVREPKFEWIAQSDNKKSSAGPEDISSINSGLQRLQMDHKSPAGQFSNKAREIEVRLPPGVCDATASSTSSVVTESNVAILDGEPPVAGHFSNKSRKIKAKVRLPPGVCYTTATSAVATESTSTVPDEESPELNEQAAMTVAEPNAAERAQSSESYRSGCRHIAEVVQVTEDEKKSSLSVRFFEEARKKTGGALRKTGETGKKSIKLVRKLTGLRRSPRQGRDSPEHPVVVGTGAVEGAQEGHSAVICDEESDQRSEQPVTTSSVVDVIPTEAAGQMQFLPYNPNFDLKMRMEKLVELTRNGPTSNESSFIERDERVRLRRLSPSLSNIRSAVSVERNGSGISGGIKSAHRFGKVYAFPHNLPGSPYVKVGYTCDGPEGDAPLKRLQDHIKICKILRSYEDADLYMSPRIWSPKFVEHLVQIDLGRHRKKQDRPCNSSCGKNHEEWFQCTFERVEATIRRWIAWVNMDPYELKQFHQVEGYPYKLKDDWLEHLVRLKILEIKWSSANEEEQDRRIEAWKRGAMPDDKGRHDEGRPGILPFIMSNVIGPGETAGGITRHFQLDRDGLRHRSVCPACTCQSRSPSVSTASPSRPRSESVPDIKPTPSPLQDQMSSRDPAGLIPADARRVFEPSVK